MPDEFGFEKSLNQRYRKKAIAIVSWTFLNFQDERESQHARFNMFSQTK